MGIFTKLLQDTVSNMAYKIGLFAPLFFTYTIGMDLAEQLSYKYKINKEKFQIAWSLMHYCWIFLFLFTAIRATSNIEKKYHMIKSRKC
jgi:hypothetical protein